MIRTGLTSSLIATALTVAGFLPYRQTKPPVPPTQQQPTFRAGTDVVEVDVSVFDKDRHVVRGLKQSDFTILEDGKPQPIVAFAAVDLPDPVPPTAKWMETAPVDVDTNELEDRRLVVILIDDFGLRPSRAVGPTSLGPGAMDLNLFASTKAVARHTISELGPADIAAVVFSSDGWKGQSFTSDRTKLIASVERLTIQGPSSSFCAVPAFVPIIDGLATVAHRRKIVFNISTGAGCAMPPAGEAISLAQAADVTIYSFDPSGLKAPVQRGGGVTGTGVLDRGIGNLMAVSEGTGGRAVVNTNAPEARVAEMFAENRSYYLLGYTSHNEKTRESLKRVEVKVNRSDVEVRSRSLYAAPPASGGPAAGRPARDELEKPPRPPSESAIAEIVPKSDLPLRVTAEPFRATDGASSVAVILGVAQPASVAATNDQIEMTARAFTVDGRAMGATTQTVPVAVAPTDAAHPRATRSEVAERLDLTPGFYSLRVYAHSKAAGLDGSVYTDVEVPDFGKDALSLSGAAIVASPGLRAGPPDALAQLLPVVPTAERTFDETSRLSAFIRVYQGGSTAPAAVALHVEVLGDRDAVLLDRPVTIPAATFTTDRSAEATIPLRVEWRAGPHLLRLQATAGKLTSERDVRFTIR